MCVCVRVRAYVHVDDVCGLCVPRLWSPLSRSLLAPLTSTRWRWVVEAPAAAPFDLPGHAPFFHFFTP